MEGYARKTFLLFIVSGCITECEESKKSLVFQYLRAKIAALFGQKKIDNLWPLRDMFKGKKKVTQLDVNTKVSLRKLKTLRESGRVHAVNYT